MCGITAIHSYQPSAPLVSKEELRRIRDSMQARGPDGFGEWYSPDYRVGLGHRRLSIIDLSDNASQPMTNGNGSKAISFNGEIYNYAELRRELIEKGYRFASNSDTEVLLHLYDEMGVAMVNRLRGMFAFALWDSKKNAMFLARDPYGIKPLYYSDDGKTIRVASQVKSLMACGNISKSKNLGAIAGFYLLGSIPEPHTIYEGIKALPAGNFIWVTSNGVSQPETYFSVSQVFADAKCAGQQFTLDEAQERIDSALRDSISHHFIADVPVGVFLSSGIDSTVITALAKEATFSKLQTLTLGFSEYQGTYNDEAPLAQKVADYYQTDHTNYHLDHKEFEQEILNILKVMDQPSIDGINTYFVSKAASEIGWKVALSGVGGDEIFGGYDSFQVIPRLVKSLSFTKKFGSLGESMLRGIDPFVSRMALSPKIKGVFKYGSTIGGAYFLKRGLFLPEELPSIMGEEEAAEGLRQLDIFSVLDKHISLDSSNYCNIGALESSLYMKNQLLRDADWAGMAHSVEIRTPLVDSFLLKEIIPVMANMDLGKGKVPLAMSPRKQLPKAIMNRPKTGFTVPIDQWIKRSKYLDQWKSVGILKGTHCPWARRWAYTVMTSALEEN